MRRGGIGAAAPAPSGRPGGAGGADRPLYALCLRGGGPDPARRAREWEEVAADVFWAAWQERKKLRPGRLKGWLSVTARNRALNLLRSRRETVPLAEDVLILSGDGPQQELESREAASLVRAALSTLEREDRELFVRRYYYGQTVARAAEEMGMNLSTAKSRLRRGRERLKEALRKAGYDVEEN